MSDPGRKPLSDADVDRLVAGDHDDPFSVLGPHRIKGATVVVVLEPGADQVAILTDPDGAEPTGLTKIHKAGLFAGPVPALSADEPYRIRAERDGTGWEMDDPYRFGPVMGEMDEHLFCEGTHIRLHDILGAHGRNHGGTQGVVFSVWAPNARRVSVVGDFNHWEGRKHPMRRRGATGIWEIFLPGVAGGAAYKYEIRDHDGNLLPLKADPYGQGSEVSPKTASVVRLEPEAASAADGSGGDWWERRGEIQATDAPISIYEVHAGSWKRHPDGRFYSYRELADSLIPYVTDLQFTHIELMPIMEHPFTGSWGYQPVGLFAPTSRHGGLADFCAFVDACHDAGLGLILDWVPGHFPSDSHGLGSFDGTHLYEHADPRQGFHPDWNTLLFNYGRREVSNYLLSNALYWLKDRKLDGLRVDAVASMLYLDYSRKAGEWIPNVAGGNENLEAVAFLKRLNEIIYAQCPGIITVAEESTAWPAVSKPTSAGGLGFGYKWNMGWMNDILSYLGRDPVHRGHHHGELTFSFHYADTENFILPLSHDEVVHGKRSLVQKMPGDRWQQIANLRALYGFMWGHPGKKLLFMGGEFAQPGEWDHDGELSWHGLQDPAQGGVQSLIRDLNHLYRSHRALHRRDCQPGGFSWISGDREAESLIAFMRNGDPDDPVVVVVSNFTPVPRENWRLGLPHAGPWNEILNTDSGVYGGSGMGNLGRLEAKAEPWHGQPASASITIPPLSTLFLAPDRGAQ